MRKIVLAAACLCCTTLALAQSAPLDAATKDRMDRAKRDASNPLRIIIEASQVKRAKGDAPATPVPAAAPPAPAPVAARPAAEGRAVAERRPQRAAEPAPSADAVPRAAAQQAATEAAAAPVASPTSTPAVAPAAVVSVPPAAVEASPASLTAAGAAAAPVAAGLAAAAAPAAPAPNPAQPAAEVLAPLKLVRYIEPEIPARIRPRLRPTNEVTVGFKVQPDGSVSNVDIRATTSRALDPVVLEAVRQWRYDPVSSVREHTVQLVFNLTE